MCMYGTGCHKKKKKKTTSLVDSCDLPFMFGMGLQGVFVQVNMCMHARKHTLNTCAHGLSHSDKQWKHALAHAEKKRNKFTLPPSTKWVTAFDHNKATETRIHKKNTCSGP